MKQMILAAVLILVSSNASAERPLKASPQGTDYAAACGVWSLQKQYERAIASCDAALRDNPMDDVSTANRGSAYLAIGQFDKALEDFSSALRLKPDDAATYFNRALAHSGRKDRVRAIADYSEAIRLMPSLAIAYNNRGNEYEAIGDKEKAVADYRKAMEIAPSLTSLITRNLRRLGADL